MIASLEKFAKEIFKWLKDNECREIQINGHVLISASQKLHLNIGTSQIENSKYEKLLGVNIDSKLSFEKHLNIICGKARAKINAFGRVAPFMTFEKRRTIMNVFFNSQFSYCPLIWMFHSRVINNKINRLHERCLRIVYSDNQSTSEELLEKDNTVLVHQRNLLVYKTNRINPNLPTLKAPPQEKINKVMLSFSPSQIFHKKFSISKLIDKQVFHPNCNYTPTPWYQCLQLRSQRFMPPLLLSNNSVEQEMKIGYPLILN